MALKLMYITNRPDVALIAQKAGVDRIWVDLEYIGKEERQHGMNTVKSHHTIEDIKKLRPLIKKSELLVRVNPIHNSTPDYESSEREIEEVIKAGADIIMLPMFKTKEEVSRFLNIVNKRAKTLLLFETADSIRNIEDILSLDGIDETHIGLNDLHLDFKKTFMFELLADGTVDQIAEVFKNHNLPFGFGGIARIGYGDLPAEYIIAEHYRIGSSMAILSRSFCNANTVTDPNTIRELFIQGIKDIRAEEHRIQHFSKDDFDSNREIVSLLVSEIVRKKK